MTLRTRLIQPDEMVKCKGNTLFMFMVIVETPEGELNAAKYSQQWAVLEQWVEDRGGWFPVPLVKL